VADNPTFNINDNIAWLFPTPVIVLQCTDFEKMNSELESLILKREKIDRGVQYSNSGGWQSSPDLLSWGQPATDELKRRIDALLYSVLVETSSNREDKPKARFRMDCWANVNREGDYNAVHNHPNALWSGVYYVSTGDPDPNTPQAGKIELLDPREAAGFVQVNHTIMSQKGFLNTEPGTIIMFPSWLKHMVHPHKGPGDRISIAFNALPVF
jgi:uncharacterized protein (TIGR02466 family)